jgi:hypothetical protein
MGALNEKRCKIRVALNNKFALYNNIMCEIIKKLPKDIINLIIPYTYSVQSKELIVDIQTYFSKKKIITRIYSRFWFNPYEENEDKNWLHNDLIAFANDYNATMFGFKERFYNIFSRNIMLKNDQNKVISYIVNLENEKVEKRINIFWGLFKPEEREEIIEIANIKLNQ